MLLSSHFLAYVTRSSLELMDSCASAKSSSITAVYLEKCSVGEVSTRPRRVMPSRCSSSTATSGEQLRHRHKRQQAFAQPQRKRASSEDVVRPLPLVEPEVVDTQLQQDMINVGLWNAALEDLIKIALE